MEPVNKMPGATLYTKANPPSVGANMPGKEGVFVSSVDGNIQDWRQSGEPAESGDSGFPLGD
ncbi:MAG: hypothetical protein OSB70_04955 [Myxococcota bacterium]|nr:hypothetical protein [Myxococcota bacterium]